MYNISLNLSYKNVLFVGGGKVAERKIKSIIDENCKITVIAPQINGFISGLVEKSRITVIKRKFELDDVSKKFFIVFAATNDIQLNRLIYENSMKSMFYAIMLAMAIIQISSLLQRQNLII